MQTDAMRIGSHMGADFFPEQAHNPHSGVGRFRDVGRFDPTKSSMQGGIFAPAEERQAPAAVMRMRARASGGGDFLDRLAVAERNDQESHRNIQNIYSAEVHAAGGRPAERDRFANRPNARNGMRVNQSSGAHLFGDDSRSDERAWETSKHLDQQKSANIYQEALEREQLAMAEKSMLEMGMSREDVKREMDLYKKDKALQQQREQAARQQAMARQTPQQRQPMSSPYNGQMDNNNMYDAQDPKNVYPTFEQVKMNAASKRRGKGGPRTPASMGGGNNFSGYAGAGHSAHSKIVRR